MSASPSGQYDEKLPGFVVELTHHLPRRPRVGHAAHCSAAPQSAGWEGQ